MIFDSGCCVGRPVDKIGNLEEEKTFSKLHVRELRHQMTDFGTRLTKGIFYILPQCVGALSFYKI